MTSCDVACTADSSLSIERLTDQQIEVRLLAGDTLTGFLKGVGATAHLAEALVRRCMLPLSNPR
jgi:hypothetical protein